MIAAFISRLRHGKSRETYDGERLSTAHAMAEYHRRKAVEMADTVAWAQVKWLHHDAMAHMYRQRIAE